MPMHSLPSRSFSLRSFGSAKMSKGLSHVNAIILILRASLSHSLLIAILTVKRKFAGTFNSNYRAASAAAYSMILTVQRHLTGIDTYNRDILLGDGNTSTVVALHRSTAKIISRHLNIRRDI